MTTYLRHLKSVCFPHGSGRPSVRNPSATSIPGIDSGDDRGYQGRQDLQESRVSAPNLGKKPFECQRRTHRNKYARLATLITAGEVLFDLSRQSVTDPGSGIGAQDVRQHNHRLRGRNCLSLSSFTAIAPVVGKLHNALRSSGRGLRHQVVLEISPLTLHSFYHARLPHDSSA